ncbi:MAG: rhodanese-like domain-containing protein [bacterium]
MFNKKLITMFFVLFLLGMLISGTVFASDKVEDAVNNYFANLPADNAMIGHDTFVEKVRADEELFILDIRQADDYNESHIKGAINLPWGPDAIAENLDKLPGDETIFVYCYSAQTANQTVALLNFAGFEAKSVKFGWNLGISKLDGYEDITETTTNELGDATPYKVDPEIESAIKDYYKGLADVNDTMFKNYIISEDMLNMMIDGEEDITILSVRQASDYTEGHIPGAINIAWAEGMHEYFPQLPDGKIVVYCYTGQTAGQVVAGLKILGYDAVSLNGGMGTPANKPYGWANKGFEVVQ